MKKVLSILTLAALLNACSDDALKMTGPETEVQEEVTGLKHAQLAVMAGDQNRVKAPGTRAEAEKPVTLELIAEIENPSDQVFESKVESGKSRHLSATCVYYDAKTDMYYATYHLQGNNYNTDLKTDVAGLIETFKIENGEVVLKNIYKSANPSELEFDFNHLYFDTPDDLSSVETDRLIAVGHLSKPTSTGKTDTQAIIAKLNLEGSPTFDYKVVYTNDKILDANGKSLGRVDAQDVNAVVRAYDTYILATRRGIALLNAASSNLFEAKKDWNGNDYFVKSEGSVKHVAKDGGYSKATFLYLSEDFPEGFTYNTAIQAKMVKVDLINNRLTGQTTIGYGNSDDTILKDVTTKDINDLVNYGYGYELFNKTFENPVSPIDGKNVLFMLPGSESQYYAALGKGGLYYKNDSYGTNEGRLDFGGRPVNGVFVDEGHGSEKHNGFIYVANGSKLSIYNRYKLDEVASWNLPNDTDGSANYVVAREADEANEDGSHDRIITVAFGQEGVKVFRFHPKALW